MYIYIYICIVHFHGGGEGLLVFKHRPKEIGILDERGNFLMF